MRVFTRTLQLGIALLLCSRATAQHTVTASRIFMVNDTTSPYYRMIPPFEYYLLYEYPAIVKDLAGEKKLAKFNPGTLPRRWYGLKYVQGKYCTYVSDGNEVKRFMITDSTTIDYCMDGSCVARIVALEQLSPTHYRLKQALYHARTTTTDIYIVDERRQVAVFAYEGQNRYDLMVSADNIKQFPALVNIADGGRAPRFKEDEDKIPFAELIKGGKL